MKFAFQAFKNAEKVSFRLLESTETEYDSEGIRAWATWINEDGVKNRRRFHLL